MTDNLLEVYPGGCVDEKQAFCSLCIETAAHGISFQRDCDLSNRVVLQSLYRLVHILLREVREVRREQAELVRLAREEAALPKAQPEPVLELEHDLEL